MSKDEPALQGENLRANLALVEALQKVADDLDTSVAPVAIAWVAAQGDDIVPLVGARTRERLVEALGSNAVVLDDDTLTRFGTAVPAGAAAGSRYPEALMSRLDSER